MDKKWRFFYLTRLKFIICGSEDPDYIKMSTMQGENPLHPPPEKPENRKSELRK
jgi:hypothetical protein